MNASSSVRPAAIAPTYCRNMPTSITSRVLKRPESTAAATRWAEDSLYCLDSRAVQRAASYPHHAVSTVAAEMRTTEAKSTQTSNSDSLLRTAMAGFSLPAPITAFDPVRFRDYL